MQIKLFTIPITNVEDYNEDLNRFLSLHKIVEIEKHVLQTGDTYSWCFCVSYLEKKAKTIPSSHKIDYMKILDAKTFAKFSKLRELRKRIAAEDGVSAYIVFTDAELAEIAKLEEINLKNLKLIKGIGDKKADKYGNWIIQMLDKETKVNEKNRKPDE